MNQTHKILKQNLNRLNIQFTSIYKNNSYKGGFCDVYGVAGGIRHRRKYFINYSGEKLLNKVKMVLNGIKETHSNIQYDYKINIRKVKPSVWSRAKEGSYIEIITYYTIA